MNTAFRTSLVSALLLLAGCGGGGTRERTESPEVEFAKDTKAAVTELQAAVKGDMRLAQREIEALVENYENYENEPLGESKAAYDAIVAGMRELKDLISQSASKRQIQAKADELANLAAKLPEAASPAQ
jgi:hypothetical protein